MKVNSVLIAFVLLCLIAPVAYLFNTRQTGKQAATDEMLWI